MENLASLDPFPGRPQKHGAVVTELLYALVLYLKGHPQLGALGLYRASYQLPGVCSRVMTPDISVVFTTEDELVDDGPAPYMPPLVARVVLTKIFAWHAACSSMRQLQRLLKQARGAT